MTGFIVYTLITIARFESWEACEAAMSQRPDPPAAVEIYWRCESEQAPMWSPLPAPKPERKP